MSGTLTEDRVLKGNWVRLKGLRLQNGRFFLVGESCFEDEELSATPKMFILKGTNGRGKKKEKKKKKTKRTKPFHKTKNPHTKTGTSKKKKKKKRHTTKQPQKPGNQTPKK